MRKLNKLRDGMNIPKDCVEANVYNEKDKNYFRNLKLVPIKLPNFDNTITLINNL